MPSLKTPGLGLITDGPVVIGTDPGGTDQLRVGGNPRFQGTLLSMSAAAGSPYDTQWQRVGVARWILRMLNTTESGGNAGSDLELEARADDGSFIANAFSVKRSTGVITFPSAAVIGTDPGGTETLRVGSNGRVAGYLSIGGGVVVRGNATYPGAAVDVLPYAIANANDVSIGDASSLGPLMITCTDGSIAIVTLNGTLHTTTVGLAIVGTWGTASNAQAHNVFWDAGTSKYRLQNHSGADRNYYVYRIGQFPTQ